MLVLGPMEPVFIRLYRQFKISQEKGSGRGKGKGVKGNEKDPILEKCCEWSWFCIKEVRYYRTKCTADGRYNQSNGNGYNEPL